MGSRKWMLVACLALPLSGCASFNDFGYEQTQRHRARAAWHDHGCRPNCYGRDYECGWKDGFYDIATGGKGCPPVVAPCQYWKPSQILEDCDRARLAYYSGFQDGVACGLRYPQTHYLKLWTSCECPGPMCENQCCPAQGCMSGNCGNDTGLISDDQAPVIEEFQPIDGDGVVPSGALEDVQQQPTDAEKKADADKKADAQQKEAELEKKAAAEKKAADSAKKSTEAKKSLPKPASQIDTSPTKPEVLPGPKEDSSINPRTRFNGVESAEPYNLSFDSEVRTTPISYRLTSADYEMIEDSQPQFTRIGLVQPATATEPVGKQL